MFSRPVRSPTSPAPTSISGAILPLTVMLPLEGFEMLASNLSIVLLPAPLWPMMPTTSPGSMLKLTSSSALNGARSSIGWPVSRRHWLSAVVFRLCNWPSWYSLATWLISMMGIAVITIRLRRFRPVSSGAVASRALGWNFRALELKFSIRR